jgi:chromosomal replication initiator protein
MKDNREGVYESSKVWESVLSAMRLNLSEATFNAYLRTSFLWEIRDVGDKLVCEIACPSSFIKNTVDARYAGQIREELQRVTGSACEVYLKVRESTEKRDEGEIAGPLFAEKKFSGDLFKRANLRIDYTFENYAVGSSNQMAYAAAQAVAKKPGVSYNPLFIYGGVGVGKTHLMQAIGHEIVKKEGGGVFFCSGEEFTNDLVEAIRFKNTEKVRVKYRKLKLLMIDDVQFIAGKPTVQEEFFHTFNTITREGGQIIMTSDRPPAEISRLEERLRSRFGAGLIVDIGPADFELRTAILLIKAKQQGIGLSMEAAQTIAAQVEGVRELQGVLIKLQTEAEMRGDSITKEAVEKSLKIESDRNGIARVITPNEVINTVGSFFGVGVQQIKGERRTKTVVWPRQIVMYMLRNELRLPLEEVGRLIGGRDHTTVMHASDKVKGEMERNEGLRTQIGEIKKRILSFPVNGG